MRRVRDVRFSPESEHFSVEDVCFVPIADISLGVTHKVRRSLLDFADIEETRPRAEDASRVPRRADPMAECDLAEVFATVR